MRRKMKDSGIEWIGEIPEDWKVTRVKKLFKVVNGATPKSDNIEFWNGNVVWITPADMNEETIEIYSSSRTITQNGLNSCGTTVVTANSIIISNRAPIGQVCIAGVELCTNQGCKSLIQILENNHKFYYYYMTIQTETLNMLGRGTTFLELSSFDLANFSVPLPSLSEQTHIANYLDHKCTKIDETIEKQKRVIEKLKAYKQSVITEAVTKGLNPNVLMKDSGVEWIGEIPEHWKVCKLQKIADIIDGDRGSEYPNDKDLVEDGVPFLNTSCLGKMKVDLTKCKYMTKEKFGKLGNGKLVEGDIIISVRGTIGSTSIFFSNEYTTAFINAQMMIIRTKQSSEYFLYLTKSKWWINLLNLLSYGTAQMQLSNKILSGLLIILPSQSEQLEISKYLDNKCSKIDTTITQKEAIIKKLTEYKKSLIYECVTGKKEV